MYMICIDNGTWNTHYTEQQQQKRVIIDKNIVKIYFMFQSM